MSGAGSWSRIGALAIVFGPVAAGLAAFFIWAADSWIENGERIARAEKARHVALSRATQARLYEPLGAAWREYAATELSGLMQTASAADAEQAVTAHLLALFERAGAPDARVAPLDLEDADGLERVAVEARAVVPEDALPAFLQSVEGEAPFLFIERLEARRVSQPSRRATRNRLALRLRIVAFRLREAPTRRPPGPDPAQSASAGGAG